jgi:hypothetical protein
MTTSDADRYDHVGDPRAYARASRAAELDGEQLGGSTGPVVVPADRLARLEEVASEAAVLVTALGRLSLALERLDRRGPIVVSRFETARAHGGAVRAPDSISVQPIETAGQMARGAGVVPASMLVEPDSRSHDGPDCVGDEMGVELSPWAFLLPDGWQSDGLVIPKHLDSVTQSATRRANLTRVAAPALQGRLSTVYTGWSDVT